LADVLRTTYELSRLQAYTERWHFLILLALCAVVVAFVGWMYRRDSVELRPGVGWLLLVLRVLAFSGLLAYYLNLEKRTQAKVTHNSRVLALVDTSLSMGLHDSDSSSVPATPNRLQQVVSVLHESDLIKKLRQMHDVVLLRFDSETGRVASLPKWTSETSDDDKPAGAATAKEKPAAGDAGDWKQLLTPQGVETRLGQSLRQLINDEQGTPVAGIIVFSDGGQNAGIEPAAAVETARQAKIPIFTVGIGSERRPANVRISDFQAPMRAYPGDSFNVTGFIQAQELADRTVSVELWSKGAEDGPNAEGRLEGSERITLASRGEPVPVKFEITPKEAGRRVFRLLVKPPPEDSNAADNQQEADIEIVDRKTRVLLMASGPMRDYIFLRNQLRRDKEMIVDVWLQSAGNGISQDAHAILDEFPDTSQELFEYDAIVAFDPDWRELSDDRIDLLERWVAEKAGGLIVIAGPVETDHWSQDKNMNKVRALYPVEFNRRLSTVDDARNGSETPWPIEFTREGLEAEFLWLADTSSRSQQIWSSFPGVYGFYNVRGAKPGATIYGRYSDPEQTSSGGAPPYLVGQFYGAGRVFYMGSGEIWRLRSLEDSYFEQFYTKLIRYVSQGRLLLGSSRGMLLVDRDRYTLGNTVAVRAQLSDPRFEPLDASQVALQIVLPDSTVHNLQLPADPARKGMFLGQFTALQEGAYRLELAVPESEGEQLTRRIQVRVPDLERENPARNDALLSEIAKATGGLYYVGADTVLGGKGQPPLVNQLKDRTEIAYLPGVVDSEFAETWMRGLMMFICGALCLEWIIRRLSKLA
jgi:hypothetical protein